MLMTLGRTLSKTFDFEGRSNRRELLCYFAFIHVWVLWWFGIEFSIEWLYPAYGNQSALETWLIFTTVPTYALIARRLHDMGCSSCFGSVVLVPFSGMVILIWMLLDKGDPEENYYGLPPR